MASAVQTNKKRRTRNEDQEVNTQSLKRRRKCPGCHKSMKSWEVSAVTKAILAPNNQNQNQLTIIRQYIVGQHTRRRTSVGQRTRKKNRRKTKPVIVSINLRFVIKNILEYYTLYKDFKCACLC